MLKSLLIFSALLVGPIAMGPTAQAQESPKTPPAEYKIPPEAASQPNPVKPSPETLAKGKKLYGFDCAMCHGKTGDGKGDMGDMKGMPDFTNPDALKNRTDGELYYIIEKGKGEMPPEGSRGKPEDLWNLVNYVRSLAVK